MAATSPRLFFCFQPVPAKKAKKGRKEHLNERQLIKETLKGKIINQTQNQSDYKCRPKSDNSPYKKPRTPHSIKSELVQPKEPRNTKNTLSKT